VSVVQSRVEVEQRIIRKEKKKKSGKKREKMKQKGEKKEPPEEDANEMKMRVKKESCGGSCQFVRKVFLVCSFFIQPPFP